MIPQAQILKRHCGETLIHYVSKWIKKLIAPCGMNCGVWRGYLAYSKNILRLRGNVIHCSGCRERNKQCAYLKGHCAQLRERKIDYCFECKEFPCNGLKKLDERYRKKRWDMSFYSKSYGD